MAKIEMTMECIEELMEKMSTNGITSLSIKDESVEIKLKSEKETIAVPVGSATASVSVTAPEALPCEPVLPKGNIVAAPVVGTFYSSPSPADNAFVTCGQSVKKGDVLFIIESMKVMNEIKSEFDGTVTTINVKDGEAVEFDQPVMIIA